MNLIKRIDKGPYSDKTIGITGPEHDANLTEIEEKFEEIDDKIANAENGEALISVNSEASMTAKWTELDAAGKTPVDGRELFRTDLNQYWKWNSTLTEKGEFSRNNIKKATAIEENIDDYASSGQVFEGLQKKANLSFITNKFNKNNPQNLLGNYIDTQDGIIYGGSQTYDTSHKMPATVGQYFCPTPSLLWGIYQNSNDSFVSGGNTKLITVPSGDYYVRISYLKTNKDSVYLIKGNTYLEEYIPYSEKVPKEELPFNSSDNDTVLDVVENEDTINFAYDTLQDSGENDYETNIWAGFGVTLIPDGNTNINVVQTYAIRQATNQLTLSIFNWNTKAVLVEKIVPKEYWNDNLNSLITIVLPSQITLNSGTEYAIAVDGFLPDKTFGVSELGIRKAVKKNSPYLKDLLKYNYNNYGASEFASFTGVPTVFIKIGQSSEIKQKKKLRLNINQIKDLQNRLNDLNKDEILSPSFQYFLRNFENNLYNSIFHKDKNNYLKFNLTGYTGSKARGFRLTPTVLSDVASTIELRDVFGNLIDSKNFTSKITDETVSTPVKVLPIGNSLTHEGVYPYTIEQESTGITFLGTRRGSTRYPYSAPPREGKGGWTLTRFINDKFSASGQSPFVHPVDPYVYYGETKFWFEVLKTNPTYGYEDYKDIANELGFDSATGLKTNPNVNDVMYFSQTAENVYKRWDGSAWVNIDESTLAFTFNPAKYRSTYNIQQPDVVPVMLGINDFVFASSPKAVFNDFYLNWKSNLDIMINGFKSDNPNVKFVICLNGPGADQSGWSAKTQKVEMYDLIQKELRRLLIKHYDNRTAENIYLIDTGASFDPIYGYPSTTEIPFSGYTGNLTMFKATDDVHPKDGYIQMGIKLLALIQYLRTL